MQFTHSVARIAVWNLGLFYPASPEKLEKQVEGLSFLDAEFACLVEVNPLDYIDDLIEGLAAKGLDYSAKIIQQPRTQQNIGFIHKAGVDVTNVRLLEGSQGTYANGRLAICCDVTIGALDVHVIAVHFKSSRGGQAQALRDSQCRWMGEHITALKEAPGGTAKTILLMGDFNMIPGQDVSNFHHLGGEDVMDFLSSWDLQDRFSHILEGGPANLLDGFAISRTPITRRPYIRGSLRLFPMHWTMNMGRESFREQVSDHLPFTASFKLNDV
ncbi:MAG: GMP synthase [Pseudomonadota bacterium]